jgi:hypothetical protein
MSFRTQNLLATAVALSLAACSADKTATPSTGSASQAASAVALGSTWADADKMPDLFSGMWMTFEGFVEGDEKLNVPYTEQAQKYVATFKHKRDIPYAEDGCKTPGLPIAMRTGPVKFTYAPGVISIYMQATGHTRFIKMNEKLDHTSPKFYGTSVGHWEGDTLVVETRDFLHDITFQYGVGKPLPPNDTLVSAGFPPPGVGAPPGPPPGAPPGGAPAGVPPPPGNLIASLSAAIWGPHGEGMYMVERMRIADRDTLESNLTIYDDTVWTKPFVTQTRHYKRIKHGVSEVGPFSGEPEEWVCTVSITSFDPATNTYVDKDPEEMVKMLDKSSGR